MKLKTYFLVIGACFVAQLNAQDPIFSQYFLVPQTLNPGFAGFMETTHIGIINRTQWPALDLGINTSYAFANTWIKTAKSGVGISLLNQRETANGYSFSQVNANYAYQIKLSEKVFFRPGIEVGYGSKNYGFQGLLLEDQINVQTDIITGSSIDLLSIEDSISFFDFSTGLLFYSKLAWLGISAKHLNRPNISLTTQGNVPLETFYAVSAGYNFIEVPFLPLETQLMLTGNYMKQGRFSRFDLGSTFAIRRFFVGATVVTNPSKNSVTNQLISSLNAFTGMKYSNFRFGISYDFNTSKIGRTGGVYELSLTYQFDSEAEKCFGCPFYKN